MPMMNIMIMVIATPTATPVGLRFYSSPSKA
jgi:hypothetical protein